METNVISFKKYKKERDKNKINRFEKIGIALNMYVVLTAILIFAVLAFKNRSFDLTSFVFGIPMIIFVVLEVYRKTKKIIREDLHNQQFVFVYFGLASGLMACSIYVLHGLLEPIPHTKEYLIVLYSALLMDMLLFYRYNKKTTIKN